MGSHRPKNFLTVGGGKGKGLNIFWGEGGGGGFYVGEGRGSYYLGVMQLTNTGHGAAVLHAPPPTFCGGGGGFLSLFPPFDL